MGISYKVLTEIINHHLVEMYEKVGGKYGSFAIDNTNIELMSRDVGIFTFNVYSDGTFIPKIIPTKVITCINGNEFRITLFYLDKDNLGAKYRFEEKEISNLYHLSEELKLNKLRKENHYESKFN